MKRILTLAVALFAGLLAHGTPPAGAQFGNPGWGPDVEVSESADEVVLTLEFGGTGHVKYRTIDGSARATQDYTAVSGQVFFRTPGTVTVTIPIVNDGIAEDPEVFRVHAVEDPNPDPFPYEGSTVAVTIDDDDPTVGAAAAGTETTATTSRGRASLPISGAAPAVTTVSNADEPPTPTTAPPADLEVQEVAAAELRPGPGFELTSDEPPAPRVGPGGRAGASPSWLAFGSGTAALGVGAVALARRRRQWSPTLP